MGTIKKESIILQLQRQCKTRNQNLATESAMRDSILESRVNKYKTKLIQL